MPTTCTIELESDNQSKVFYSGQVLRGTVHLTLTKEKTIKGVVIKFIGKSYCYWKKTYGKSTRIFTAEEYPLHQQAYLVGSSEGERKIMPGPHHFPFECYLPPHLPTSFEGKIGHIRYKACVTIEVPMWPNKEFEQPFAVYKAIDLNADPRIREPIAFKMDKTFPLLGLLCCCKSDPLEFTVRTPVSGYVPGQTVPLEIVVSNKSNQRVTAFTVQLIKQITYHVYNSGWHQNLETIVISEGEAPGCDAKRDNVLTVNVPLPLLPPTDWTTSQIVKVRYYCRVIGRVGLFHRNPELQLPITIGTFPIQDAQGAQPPNYIPTVQMPPSAPVADSEFGPQPTALLNPTNPLLSK